MSFPAARAQRRSSLIGHPHTAQDHFSERLTRSRIILLRSKYKQPEVNLSAF
jgi:hypothetical protein